MTDELGGEPDARRRILVASLLALVVLAAFLALRSGAPEPVASEARAREQAASTTPLAPRVEFLSAERAAVAPVTDLPPRPDVAEVVDREPDAKAPRATVIGRITDLAGNPLTYTDLDFLLPNHDPLASSFDPVADARGNSEIFAIEEGFENGFHSYQQVFLLPESRFMLDLPETFSGKLQLVVRGRVIDWQKFAVGDPEPWFRVDVGAVRAALATLRLRVHGAKRWIAALARSSSSIDEQRLPAIDSAQLADPSEVVIAGIAPGTCEVSIGSEEAAFVPQRVELVAGGTAILEFTAAYPGFVRVVPGYPEGEVLLSGITVRLDTTGVPIHDSALPVKALPEGGWRIGPLPPGPATILIGGNAFEVVIEPQREIDLIAAIRAPRALLISIRGMRVPTGVEHLPAHLEVDDLSGRRIYDDAIALRAGQDGAIESSVHFPTGSYRLRLSLLDGRILERTAVIDASGDSRIELR